MLLRNPGCPTTHKIIPPRTTCLQFLASVTIKNSARLSLFGSSHWCYYNDSFNLMDGAGTAAVAVAGAMVFVGRHCLPPYHTALGQSACLIPTTIQRDGKGCWCVRARSTLTLYGTRCSLASFLCVRARSTLTLHIVQEAPRPLFFRSVTRAIFWYDSSSCHEIVPQNCTCLFQFLVLTEWD